MLFGVTFLSESKDAVLELMDAGRDLSDEGGVPLEEPECPTARQVNISPEPFITLVCSALMVADTSFYAPSNRVLPAKLGLATFVAPRCFFPQFLTSFTPRQSPLRLNVRITSLPVCPNARDRGLGFTV